MRPFAAGQGIDMLRRSISESCRSGGVAAKSARDSHGGLAAVLRCGISVGCVAAGSTSCGESSLTAARVRSRVMGRKKPPSKRLFCRNFVENALLIAYM